MVPLCRVKAERGGVGEDRRAMPMCHSDTYFLIRDQREVPVKIDCQCCSVSDINAMMANKTEKVLKLRHGAGHIIQMKHICRIISKHEIFLVADFAWVSPWNTPTYGLEALTLLWRSASETKSKVKWFETKPLGFTLLPCCG
ncbi:uncharacterized [Tachysurus ichikawai]